MTQTVSTLNLGLADAQRSGVCAILNHALADLSVIYTRTRNYHWNVTGMQFHSLHELFEEQYGQMAEQIDEVAERVRMLGERPLGTLAEFLQQTHLSEQPGAVPDAPRMIAILLDDHEHLIRELREGGRVCDEQHNDMGTSDFLTELMQEHEKMAWMLRAFIE